MEAPVGTRVEPSPPRIRVLGELQLVGRDGRALALPASRKTRALLGYLIATGQPHRRERLCDLLWDGPLDPRAELRWSLSKLRPLLDGGTGMRLKADRERVGIEIGNAPVDLLQMRSLVGTDISAAPTDALKHAAALFGGEFLDGLDLPLCYRYQEWCMAEREAVSRLRLAVLTALVERLQDHPADALSYARALAIADPLSESGHAAVVRLLSRMGRNREARAHYERARQVLETELGAPPSDELKGARLALRPVESTGPSLETFAGASDRPPAQTRPTSSASFIGRDGERALIQRIITATILRRGSDVVLVIGEPGIGKSHLLGYIGEAMISAGGTAFAARAFEAEATRPYGVWIDVLRTLIRERSSDELPRGLGLLLPELGVVAGNSGDRAQLFDAVVDLLRQSGADRPTVITLDDIQWIDEASSSLLHYVVRHLDAASGLLIACAARTGEIEDNAAASGVLRSLRRERRQQEIELTALSSAETAELVRLIDRELDAAHVFAESEGNPLFTLELAHAHRRGEAGPGRTVETIIAGQLAPLTPFAHDLLVWAAAHGRAFTPEDLARVTPLEITGFLAALGELERHGLVRSTGDNVYDFTHDLVRQAAYRTLSQPRRRLVHRHITQALTVAAEHDNALAADLVRHAVLAQDYGTATRASILAGERALRLFANAEASSFAELGLRHVDQLSNEPAKLEARIALIKIRILAAAGPGMRPLPPLAETLADVTKAAEGLGLQTAAATGHYLLSVLHQEAGDALEAEKSTLRATEAGRAADTTTRARQLANTARCLLELETEIGRSRELIREAGAIVDDLELELCELHWAEGLLQRWDGREDLAVSSVASALALARTDEDRWREYKCLTWLAMLEYELGQYAEMRARCAEVKTVAARLGDHETPFVETLQALALLAADEDSADDVLADALRRLRAIDDKSYLAYALNSAASLHRRRGRNKQARVCAKEALAVASIMQRTNEIALARAMLARVGDDASIRELEAFAPAASDRDDLSARARSVLLSLTTLPRIPTMSSTPDRQNRDPIPIGGDLCPTSSSSAASRRRSRRRT